MQCLILSTLFSSCKSSRAAGRFSLDFYLIHLMPLIIHLLANTHNSNALKSCYFDLCEQFIKLNHVGRNGKSTAIEEQLGKALNISGLKETTYTCLEIINQCQNLTLHVTNSSLEPGQRRRLSYSSRFQAALNLAQ